MKRADAERARQIINDWISYQNKKVRDESIAFEGSLDEGVGSSTTPNPTLAKAERLEGQEAITAEERRASLMISVFSDRERAILTTYELWRNQTNPISKRLYTHEDIAFKLGLKKERYMILREGYVKALVDGEREFLAAYISKAG